MKRIFQAGAFTSRVGRGIRFWKHGEGQWKPWYWGRTGGLSHNREVFFKERQAVDLAWANLGVGALKFLITCVGLGITVCIYWRQEKKSAKQRHAALLLDFSREARCILESYNKSESPKIVYQVEKALRANEVKWLIRQSPQTEPSGLYCPTEFLQDGLYRVDPLEIILALSARQSPLSPYFVLAKQTKRPRQLDQIEEKFSHCVMLFAQLEKLAVLYSHAIQTASDGSTLQIDRSFFPVDVVTLVTSISRGMHKDPLLVAAVHSYIERLGERGQLALDFIRRVDNPDFVPVRWTQHHLVTFLEKYKTTPKRRSVPDGLIAELLDDLRKVPVEWTMQSFFQEKSVNTKS